jgi:ABC-type dipeptide/oligopeptide/nickel transport system ATPase component
MILVEAGLQNLERSMYENVIDVLTNPNASWTLVIISNDPFVAERCDEVIIMDKGKIVDKGAFEDIQKSPHFSPIFTTSISRILNRLKGPTTVQNKE